jgi:alkylhydroperoxidase family enzyme
VISISIAREIWRPAVSGTGGIQDDRIAGRQKLVALRAARLGRSPACVRRSSPCTREHGVTETQIYAGKRQLLTQKVTA